MKRIFGILSAFLMSFASGGESALALSFQPLDGLGAGRVFVVQVTCHQWFSHGGGSAVDLINARNVPPTDNVKEATMDLNLASRGGLKFSTSDLGDPQASPSITFDASQFNEAALKGYDSKNVVRASLECLRRCLPTQLKKTKVTLLCKEADRIWLTKIVSEFNTVARENPFYES